MLETPSTRFDSALGRHGLRALAACAVVVLCLSGCSPSVETAEIAENFDASDARAVATPRVERDLDAIRERGVLRVLIQNSGSSYQLLRGQEYGFEFELAQALASELGVALSVVIPDGENSALAELNLGNVDIVALPLLLPELEEDRYAHYTRPYSSEEAVLVVHRGVAETTLGLDDLGGRRVTVAHWSREEELLFALREQGHDIRVGAVASTHSREEILERVADGELFATIADRNIAESVRSYHPQLHVAFAVDTAQPLHWAVRKNSPNLATAINQFIDTHIQETADGRVARSTLYNVLRKKYFSDASTIRRRYEHPFRVARTGRLSPYDDLFRAAAENNDFDWRLLASVAYQESNFDPTVVSWANAVGLMQVRPKTAASTLERLREPAHNIRHGAAYLRELYDRYDYLDDALRIQFALAAYNCGQGHLDDARQLSVVRGEDPNSWPSIEESLLLLRRPEYHQQARYGYVRGDETVDYVREVLARYRVFAQLVDETAPRLQTASAPIGTSFSAE